MAVSTERKIYVQIGLTQQDRKCSDSASKPEEQLVDSTSAIEKDAELIVIRMKLGTTDIPCPAGPSR